MSDFFQNGAITTLHALGNRDADDLQEEIAFHAKSRPVALVLPCLYSELKGTALPRIVEKLSTVSYLDSIVVSLGVAEAEEFAHAKEYFSQLPQKTRVVWNDGPRIGAIKGEMGEAKLALGEPGKGLAAWFAYGYIISSSNARVIALHDCDIETYEPVLLHRLVYPLVNPAMHYQFAKGYYARVTDRLHGRVTRVFVTPLVRALKELVKGCSFLEYLDSFRYPLAGEFAMTTGLARVNKTPGDWGLEVGTLAEVYRNASSNGVCQVDLEIYYEHKHQEPSIGEPSGGLMRMCREVALALFTALSLEGVVLDEPFFNTLRALYLRKAQEFISRYADLARINGLNYDLHREDMLAEAFQNQLREAGESFMVSALGTPQIPEWNRVIDAVPGVLETLKSAVEVDNA
ncbi:MAG: glycosyl transferase [Deltaproteobacteria bacterium]|nr:MAG: glycosyl transferase [Deltaproteobacteria bacterium]